MKLTLPSSFILKNDRFSNSAPPPPLQVQRTNSYNGIPMNSMINNPPLISIPPSSAQQPNINNHLLSMSMHSRPTFDNFINTSSNNSSQQTRRY